MTTNSPMVPAWAQPDQAVERVEDAAVLLRSGRATMALAVIERLPEQFRQAVAAARAQGRRDVDPRDNPEAAAAARAEVQACQAAIRDLMDEQRHRQRELVLLRAQARDLTVEIERQRGLQAELKASTARRKRELAQLGDPRPRLPKPHERLAAALAAELVTVEAIAELLRVRPDDIEPIAEGRVTLAQAAWAKVLGWIEEVRPVDGPMPPKAA